MAKFAKDLLEVICFFFLTATLYFLFSITLPLFREPHGLLVMSELADFSRSGLFFYFLFGSACACVLLGVIILKWIKIFSPGVMANLWASTYLFLWSDSIFSFSLQMKSFRFLFSLAIGLLFIYLFFFLLNYLEPVSPKPEPVSDWKIKLVNFWIWGWMGFYFGLSGFLVYYSLDNQGFRLPLAVAAMFICFLNYLLCLFLKKSEGKDVEGFSRVGRVFFVVWIFSLFLVWFGQRWMV